MTDATNYKGARSIIALLTLLGLCACAIEFAVSVGTLLYALSYNGAFSYVSAAIGMVLSVVGFVATMAMFNALSVVFDIADRAADQCYVLHKIKDEVKLIRQNSVPGEFE